ncbi:hypothetical protein CMK11_05545 [Candidatus Poribacteria bacterium]|nr:hypothetical protein [Candidatus Poribacteria bacterium]
MGSRGHLTRGHETIAPRWRRFAACVLVVTLWAGVGAAVHGVESPWTVVHDPQLRRQLHGSYQLAFVDADDGWAVGPTNYGTPVSPSFAGYKTADGGRTWRDIDIPLFRVWLLPGDPEFVEGQPRTYPGAKPYSVHRPGPREAWVGGGERIAHTTDAGETWELLNIDVAAIDSLAVQRMKAGGPNVNRSGQFNVYGVYFWSSTDGYAWCVVQTRGEDDVTGYALLVTDDGGHSWSARATSSATASGDFSGALFTMTSPSVGWVASRGLLPVGLWHTSDGWRTLSQPIEIGTAAAHFASDGRASAITSWPRQEGDLLPIERSIDGGATWHAGILDGGFTESLVDSYTLQGLTFRRRRPRLGRWERGEYPDDGRRTTASCGGARRAPRRCA